MLLEKLSVAKRLFDLDENKVIINLVKPHTDSEIVSFSFIGLPFSGPQND